MKHASVMFTDLLAQVGSGWDQEPSAWQMLVSEPRRKYPTLQENCTILSYWIIPDDVTVPNCGTPMSLHLTPRNNNVISILHD